MALSTTPPPGWNPNQDYTYTDPTTGITYYGMTGDGTVLPAPAGYTPNPAAVGTGAITNPTGTGPGGPAVGGNLGGLIDAAAYANTQNYELEKQRIEALIRDAEGKLVLAQNADARAQALFEIQRWQAELNRIVAQQQRYDAMTTTLLSAAVDKSSRPNDYFQYSQLMAGGRDIFDRISGGATPAFQAASGPTQPGNITDILARLGVPAAPQTTPLGTTGQMGGSGATTGGAGIPGVPAPGVGGVTEAQADAVADGLGIDRRILREYVRERGSLPSLPDLQAWMNAKGYRNPDGSMTGRMPAGDPAPGRESNQTAGGGAGTAGGPTAVAAPPAAAAPPAGPPGTRPTTGDWEWARAMVPGNIKALGPEYEDYFAQQIARGRGNADEGFYNASGEQNNNGAWD